MYLLIRGFDLSFRTEIRWFTRPMSLFTHQKMTKKPGTKFRRSTGDFSKSFQFKNILTTKKWAVPAYIRGFDSFKPPMSRFCLWKAALFTRFWSLHLPFLAWLTRFWSRNFSQGDLIYEVLISGKTIYIYYIYIMYIRGFDLASDTQTGCYLRGLDLTQSDFGLLQCTRFWSLCWRDAGSWFTRFVSLPDARNLQNEIKTS